MTIHIDLKTALTDEAVQRALPHHGQCYYSAPCIIGACMPKGTRRKRLDNENRELGNDVPSIPSVSQLVWIGLIEFATPQQLTLARELQCEFDHGTKKSFLAKVADVRRELAK